MIEWNKLQNKNISLNLEHPKLIQMQNKTEIQTTNILTCPNCGHKKEEVMPTDACVYFYECEECKMNLKPKPGDCCVYCSYGTVKCPPIQAGKGCC
jgi:hypothetical protein